MRREFEPGYILHTRPYRDTSIIIDFLSRDHGRVSLLAKGARSAKSRQRQFLQPFTPLLLSWQGRGELKTLTQAEATGPSFGLRGSGLYAAFYLNELTIRLFSQQDQHTHLLPSYELALSRLVQIESVLAVEPVLRSFELSMLQLLGYGLDLSTDADGNPIRSGQLYCYIPEHGFVMSVADADCLLIPAEHLRAMAADEWADPAVLRSAKLLLRGLLSPLLGSRPLQSRALFEQLRTISTEQSAHLQQPRLSHPD